MTYKSFSELFLQELHSQLSPAGVEFQRQPVAKTNGIVKDGVSVRYPSSPTAPLIYLDELYKLHQDGYRIEELAEVTRMNLEKNREWMEKLPVLTQESAREHLYCAVINSAENEELLKKAPHRNLEDLSVIARFQVGDSGSFLVTHDLCQTLQMTPEEIMEAAQINTDRQEYKCQNMTEVLYENLVREGLPKDYVEELLQKPREMSPLWVLSNHSGMDGAVAITSQNALAEAHKKLGEDFYILPSSRHEVILVPQSMMPNVDELKALVCEVNATQVQQADKLSDSVYRFDGRYFSRADVPEKQKTEAFTQERAKRCSYHH